MPEAGGLPAADVVVLCGGLGKRLREAVPDRPKPLAEVAGRPFLDILLDFVSGFGPSRFILCAGYMGEHIQEHFARGAAPWREVVISCEDRPLGTAGAVKHAQKLIRNTPFLVLNGDSLCWTDLAGFWRFHQNHGGWASVVLAPPEEGTDYGAVSLDSQGRIKDFSEKSGAHTGQHINAGIYLFTTQVLEHLQPGQAASLENDVLPELVRAGQAWGWPVKERVVDIGTPQRYAAAQSLLRTKPTTEKNP